MLCGSLTLANRDISSLFLAHGGELFSYLVRKLRNRDLAADLTQETFTRYLARSVDGVAVIGNERAYLFRTALNLAVDHVRQGQRRPQDESGAETLEMIGDPRPTQERIFSGRQELGLVKEALQSLPERTREIFILQRVDGLTYREIAERLEISDSSVQKHLAAALQAVMQHIRAANQS